MEDAVTQRTGGVLLLADSLNQGGAERQLSLLARSAPPGWGVRVWAASGGFFAGEMRGAGVPVRTAGRAGALDPFPIPDLYRTIADARPGLVHAWGWLSCLWALPACRVAGIPLVAGFVRMGTAPAHLGGKGRLMMRLARSCDLVVANSAAGLRSWGVPPGRGWVVPNALDPARLPGALPERPAGGPLRAVMAANVSPLKDHSTMVEALRLLAGRLPEGLEVTAPGGGPGLPELRRRCEDLLAAGTLRLPGRVPDVMPLLMDADVGLLLSTRGEGCSNSVMEYMAAGLPVVCTDEGGNRELVEDGVTGFLVPPRDAVAVADSLEMLAASRDLRVRMGRAGRARLEVRHSAGAMLDMTARVYDRLQARLPGPPFTIAGGRG